MNYGYKQFQAPLKTTDQSNLLMNLAVQTLKCTADETLTMINEHSFDLSGFQCYKTYTRSIIKL